MTSHIQHSPLCIPNGDRVVATDSVELKDLDVRRDGTFTITVDPSPANGQRNHLQTGPKTTQLFIRDTLSDWNTQTPSSLSVQRVSGPATKPRTFDRLVAETVRTAKASGSLWIDLFILRASFSTAPNVVPQPPRSASTISRSSGNYRLADDEALVVTTRPGPATYTGLTVQDVWTVTPDYWKHQSSLTGEQAVPNADGTQTVVISHRDPGVHNWVDTAGLREGTFLLRWQGASLLDGGDEPYVSSQVVKLSELSSALPAGTQYVTPEQRRKQLKERRAGFERRIATCGRWHPVVRPLRSRPAHDAGRLRYFSPLSSCAEKSLLAMIFLWGRAMSGSKADCAPSSRRNTSFSPRRRRWTETAPSTSPPKA